MYWHILEYFFQMKLLLIIFLAETSYFMGFRYLDLLLVSSQWNRTNMIVYLQVSSPILTIALFIIGARWAKTRSSLVNLDFSTTSKEERVIGRPKSHVSTTHRYTGRGIRGVRGVVVSGAFGCI